MQIIFGFIKDDLSLRTSVFEIIGGKGELFKSEEHAKQRISISNLPTEVVATIGNFDGVHIGHQSIIKHVLDVSKKLKLPSLIITFDPQSAEFLKKEKCPSRLTRLREKIFILQSLNVDYVLVIHFNQKLADLSAKDFVKNILIDCLHVKHLVVVGDCHFGKGGEGCFDYLEEQSRKFDFVVEKMQIACSKRDNNFEERRISSTWIREVLAKGDLKTAKKLLGRDYSMCGRVVAGKAIARSIGFPTVNIYVHRIKSPLLGVYAVKVTGIDKNPIQGVANIGYRPTVNGRSLLLEVHLFDFNKNIYGKYVNVIFLHKLRDEKQFESIELLKQQIVIDVTNARKYFENL